MIRRARLSFKPNVRPGGRAPGSAGSARDGGVATDAEPALDPGKETAGPWEGSIAPTSGGSEEVQPGEGSQAERIEAAATVGNELPSSKTPSAPLQRRKRISTLPNLAKPRVSNSASAVVPPPKPSQADVTSTPPVIPAPCKNEGSVPEKGKVLSPQKSHVPVSSLQGQHVTLPEKRTPVPQVPQFSPYKKSVLKHTEVGPTKAVECAQTEEPSPLKERPSQKSCSNELFEVIKKTTPKKLITTNLEKERLKRAQKLRDLLRSELRKERKAWKEKHPLIDPMVEPEKSKMTVRDFIYFIPTSNPMSSSIEENKSSEKSSPVESPPTGLVVKNSAEDDDLDDDDVEDDDSQLLAPRVKVAEDGSIILDEESLTVEVSRNKAPIVEGNDPIFERGSTTTYSSFRKKNYSKPWSDKETDMFFLAISMVGTDFSMIGQLFPHRERIEIKNKFKREERINAWRIDKAFRETKDFDFEFFAHLLEKALEAGKKNKTKSIQPRKTSAKSRKKQKDKTAEQSLCDESVISDEEGADAGTAEKENKRSLDVDDCSGVADHVSVKKKRSKRKKENTKEPEVENESQDDDLTYKPKKKSTKRKTTVQDTDNAAELQSVDDGSLKETPAVKKTRVQKNKPDYKESEFEDDENDADYDITEDFEVEDVHNAGEVEPTTETKDEACEEENSLVLFSEEGDYQSGPDDLSSLKQSLSEVNEAVSQASDVSLVASNSMLGDPEPVSVAQEETSHSACDQFDISAKASNVGSEQDKESKDKQKILQGRRARPAPNLSKASVKKEVSPEEQSEAKPQADPSADLDVGKSDKVQKEDVGVDQQRQADESAKADYSSPSHNGHEESSVKPPIPGRGRLPTPEPNLPVRTSTRKAKLDITDSKDIEGVEKCAPNKTEDTQSIKREGDVSSVDKHRQEGSSPVKKDVASDPSQAEESKTVQLACDRGDTGKEKPSLPVRGRLRPKPNLTRAPAKQKSSDTEQEVQHSQVSHVDIKSPSHTPSRDGENEVKERVESSMPQDECGKSNIKPAPLARGRFQRPKPNLIKASSRKEAFDVKEDSSAPSAAHAAGDAGRDLQSDSPSGKQDNEKLLNTVSESSQDSCNSEINSHPSSSLQLIQDSPVNQDHLTEASCISETKSVQSPINPAPLARGQLQRPKPNLLRSSGRKGELEMKERESLEASSGAVEKRSPTGLVKEVPSLLLHTQESCAEKPGSMLPLKVDDENLKEEPNTLLKPALLPKGRFQRPKPNLLRAAAKRDRLPSPDEPKDVRKGEARVESAVESTDTTSNIPVSEMETTPMPLKSNKSLVAEDDSVTLEKIENGASVDSTPAMIDKGQSASDDERKALKPVLTRAPLQRSKPNLSKSITSGADTADLLSTVHEEEKRTGTTSTDIIGPNIKLYVEVLSGGDAEMKSSAVKDTCDEAVVKALAQPKEAISNVKQGEAASLKPVRTRFTKPSPNLGRAAMRKETSSTEPKTLVPKKGQETVKGIDDDPELLKVEDMPDTSNTGHGCKEAGHVIEKKSAAIKPAQLKRGRLIRLLPNLVKPSTKTLSPLQSKTNEDLNSSPTIKDKDHVVATSSPANKRKASDSNVDLSPKKLCSSGTPQKPPCLSDSEVQGSLSNEPPSSSPSSSVQDTATPPLSRFGRPLRKLSTTPSALPKSGTSSDRPEKEKAVRNVKSPTTKVSKPMSSKSKGKTTLVKIRATQQQEDDEEDADLGFEDENYDLSPDMQNLAPVFVPFSLRSPKPVTAEIEETVEELEIPVELVDLPNSITLDLGRTPFQHVMDPAEAHPEKSGQCDGSAEAAMTLISMGSSVYEPIIGEFSPDRCTENIMSSMRRDNQEERSSPKRFSSSSNRPHVCATESCVTQDPRIVESPHSAPNVENQAQSDAVSSAEDLPDPVNNAIEERSCPVMPGDAQQHAFTSQDVSVSDCLLREHGTGEEATFILTLVEIPINDDYAYSCDSNVAESLPAPLFISSGSSQALTQNLNASVETVSYEPCVVGQDVKDLMFSRKRSAQCLDDGHDSPPQKKPHVSEQVVEMEIKSTAVDIDGDGKVAHEVSVTEPKPEVSQIGVIALRERPPNSPAAKTCSTVPVEMPGMSMADSLDRNLPLAYASPLSTLKTPLKRPGRKPLGFLSLVCKEKQSKKANEENRKQKAVPRLQCRKSSPRVRGPQKESTDLNLENVSDSEVPSSSPIFSPAEMQSSTTEDAEAVPSTSQMSDNQEPQPSSKSHDLSTEEEAAPVSEYFFSDIFMEVDD